MKEPFLSQKLNEKNQEDMDQFIKRMAIAAGIRWLKYMVLKYWFYSEKNLKMLSLKYGYILLADFLYFVSLYIF